MQLGLMRPLESLLHIQTGVTHTVCGQRQEFQHVAPLISVDAPEMPVPGT